jgi:hypothetical protein
MSSRLRLQGLARALIAGALVLGIAAAPGSARQRQTSPTRAQIARAVSQAERSSSVWATINICNSARYPNVMGIRGQMPTLGFPARLRMVFQVDYWQYPNNGFRLLPGVRTPVDLGQRSRGRYQAGVRFQFQPHAGLLRGRVRYQWQFGRRIIGHLDRVTRINHAAADYADPRGFSDWKCVIP